MVLRSILFSTVVFTINLFLNEVCLARACALPQGYRKGNRKTSRYTLLH